jgi:small multidrug resistance pump
MHPVIFSYACLLLAIALEVVGTSALQQSRQFTLLAPTALMLGCYAASFYLLSHALKVLPVGIAYAIWSGLGIVLISLVGYIRLGQRLDGPAILGIGLILAGVLLIQLCSRSLAH